MVRALVLVAFLSGLRFMGLGQPAKPEFYPIHVEGVLCTGPRFA
jgi:hypothetical protein